MIKKLATTLVLILTILVFNAVTRAQPQRRKPAPAKPAPIVSLSAGDIARSGSFENELYKNNLLGLSITIPKGWDLVRDEVNKAGMDTAKEKMTANKSKQFEKAMDKSLSETRILFQAYSYNPVNGKTGVMGFGVETASPGLTLAGYTEFNKNLVLTTNVNSRLKKDVYKKTFAGMVFNVFEIEIPRGDDSRSQTYFVTKRSNVMVFFVFTYTDEANRQLMESSLGTLTSINRTGK